MKYESKPKQKRNLTVSLLFYIHFIQISFFLPEEYPPKSAIMANGKNNIVFKIVLNNK